MWAVEGMGESGKQLIDFVKYLDGSISFQAATKRPNDRFLQQSPPHPHGRAIEEIPRVDGILVKHIDIADTKSDGYCPLYGKHDDNDETNFAILGILQLLNHTDTGRFLRGKQWQVKILYHHVTPLGLAFAKAPWGRGCLIHKADRPWQQLGGRPGDGAELERSSCW